MNATTIEPPNPRVLIVEDKETTVSTLSDDLRDAIEGVEIESARTVVAGQAKLDAAYDQKRPFDVAILDFKLPHDENSPAEIADFSLGFLRDLCPDTLIIHVTARPEDPDFQRVRPPPNTPEASKRLFFGKTYGWMQKVVEACARHIRESRVRFHSDRIRAEFERLFGPQDESERVFRSTGRTSSGRGDRARGLEIAVFCDEAGEHWNDLEAPLQKELGDALGHLQDADGHHYVGVVAEYPPNADDGKKEAI